MATPSEFTRWLRMRSRIEDMAVANEREPVIVVMSDGRTLQLRLHEPPPPTRADCRDAPRPCPYLRCRHHLYTVTGTERRGRTARGYKMSASFWPGWLETPPAASCELDIAEAVKPGELGDIETIARAIRQTVDWTRRLLRRAERRMKTAARRLKEEQCAS